MRTPCPHVSSPVRYANRPGKPTVVLWIRLVLFAVGIADAIAGREKPPLIVHPLVPDARKNDVPVPNAGVVVAVPARAPRDVGATVTTQCDALKHVGQDALTPINFRLWRQQGIVWLLPGGWWANQCASADCRSTYAEYERCATVSVALARRRRSPQFRS